MSRRRIEDVPPVTINGKRPGDMSDEEIRAVFPGGGQWFHDHIAALGREALTERQTAQGPEAGDVA